MFKILIGCEESQRVCIAFREQGFEVYSCDLSDCSGGHPEWHLKMDIFDAIKLYTWDMMICFPPCTYLTITANRHFLNNPERWEKRLKAVKFIYKLMNAPIKHIAIENPVGAISTHIRRPDQYIQPYDFGYPGSKKTCLWLKNLPLLKSTEKVSPIWKISSNGKRYNPDHWNNPSSNKPENTKLRSKTYLGIANAMSNQWGNYLLREKTIFDL